MPRVHERRGLWFDEFEIGDLFRHRPGRTITEADNIFYSAITMNRQSLHFDAEAAQASPYGRVLVNAGLTLGITTGLASSDLTEGTGVANLGYDEVTFPAPVFAGDTLTSTTEVLATRRSASRPDTGIVTFEHRATNQRDELVCRVRRAALVRRQPS